MKTITITAFNRPDLLEKCFASVSQAWGVGDFKLVVVLQEGNKRCLEIIHEYRAIIDTFLETHPSGNEVDSYITNNRLLGYFIGFEFWKSKYVVALEDDVEISKDSLKFIDAAYERYSADKKFRGVNLGSKLPYSNETALTFSKIRYGIHGPASMLTKNTWSQLNIKKVLENHQIIFDAQIEFELKSGFMITPNCSRYLDNGHQGSHFFGGGGEEYFVKLRESFIGENVEVKSKYTLCSMNPRWREDCKIYYRSDNFYYLLLRNIYKLSYFFPGILNLKAKLKFW
jgi:hypothetical protein